MTSATPHGSVLRAGVTPPSAGSLHSVTMAQLDERLLDVDSHGCVRVPGALWVGMALLARYFMIAVGVVFSRSQ